ncbi:MAG: GNAT family N-acetyltransferase [Candidatus Competibacteraceae bacterium]|nr:GNAT family N-acetyltransferase [Candidatus Competibacteraceae bacterium]
MNLLEVHTSEDLEIVRTLFREYEQFLGVDLCFQGFAEELATLPGRYAPPLGRLLLAREGQQTAGCVALRPLHEQGACEMKRLFVRPAYRGQGLGLMLAQQIIQEAITVGYTVIRLDTLDTLKQAMRIYETLGFQRCTPYYANPLPGVVYWERALSKPAPALRAVSTGTAGRGRADS